MTVTGPERGRGDDWWVGVPVDDRVGDGIDLGIDGLMTALR